MELEEKKIRENGIVEESKLKMGLEKLQTEDREKVGQHEINLRRLDKNIQEPVKNDIFHLSAAIKFVPPFGDVDITQFLNAFEKAMTFHDFEWKNRRN